MDTEPTTQAEQPSPQGQQTLQLPCPGCGYNLSGLPDIGNCPECNTIYDQAQLWTIQSHKRTKPSLILLGAPLVVLLIIGTPIFVNNIGDVYMPIMITFYAFLPASIISCVAVPIEFSVAMRPKPQVPRAGHAMKVIAIVLLVLNCIMASGCVTILGACIIAAG